MKLLKISLAIILSLMCVFALVACDPVGGNETESTSDIENLPNTDNGGEETTDPIATYTVTVKDYNGEVPKVDILVELLSGDEVVAMKKIDKTTGVATFVRERGDLTFTLQAAKGVELYYDVESCVLTSEITEVDVTVYDRSSRTQIIYPSFGGDDSEERAEYEAAVVSEGATYVDVDREGKGFYVFYPERGGIYRFKYISSDPDTKIGYFGEVYAILSNSAASPEQVANGYFELEVKNFTAGQQGGSNTIVIGLESKAENAVLVIERIGDPVKVMPWTNIDARQIPQSFEKTDGKTLTDISVIDPDAKVVYSEADGFYHYGTSDGPVVYVRIDSANKFTPSFFEMSEGDSLGKVFYDENGKETAKESYNLMIKSYAEICDDNGVCPLTRELAEAIKNIGDHKGWWDFSDRNTEIFSVGADGEITGVDTLNIVIENAWLFACCYVAE